MRYYSGIGSRETPNSVLEIMAQLGQDLEAAGYTLRSGGAQGADRAFELLVQNKEIYTPQSDIPDWAFDTVDQFHPAGPRLKPYARRLHARNAMILLGKNGDEPSEFVICWTPNGAVTGGTAQGLRIAKHWDIPIFNLFENF